MTEHLAIDPATAENAHRTVWELLPWSVNNTLEPDEMRLVESHLETCTICRREFAAQQRLGASVADVDDFATTESRHWDALRKRIRAEQEAGPASQPGNGFAAFFEMLREALQGFWKWPAAAALACLALFAVIGLPLVDSGTEYRTLTNPAAIEGPVLRIKVAEGVEPDELKALLEPLDMEIVLGPSETGVYTVKAKGEQPLETAAAELAEMNEIEFATVRNE